MHIPKGPTAGLELALFEPALQAALQPSPDYDAARWLYVPNTYSEYRYILGTRGKKPLICVGINPSTAAPDALDPTLQSAQRIALANGYDSFLMFNVYAQRATRPDDMEHALNPALHAENRKAFRYLRGTRLRRIALQYAAKQYGNETMKNEKFSSPHSVSSRNFQFLIFNS